MFITDNLKRVLIKTSCSCGNRGNNNPKKKYGKMLIKKVPIFSLQSSLAVPKSKDMTIDKKTNRQKKVRFILTLLINSGTQKRNKRITVAIKTIEKGRLITLGKKPLMYEITVVSHQTYAKIIGTMYFLLKDIFIIFFKKMLQFVSKLNVNFINRMSNCFAIVFNFYDSFR